MIEIVPASPSHIGPIATRLRSIDRMECLVAGHSPKQALRVGITASAVAWTAKIDGRPEAMFGVTTVSLMEGRGRAWLLMTDEAARQHRALVRFGRLYTEALQRHYTVLENHVHAHNDKAIRWLARLGFVIGPVDVINGQPMRPFIRCAVPLLSPPPPLS